MDKMVVIDDTIDYFFTNCTEMAMSKGGMEKRILMLDKIEELHYLMEIKGMLVGDMHAPKVPMMTSTAPMSRM